jgi:hypothetical protein
MMNDIDGKVIDLLLVVVLTKTIFCSIVHFQDIPRIPKPIYNLAMKDIVLCCTNIDKDARVSQLSYIMYIVYIHLEISW